MDDREWRPLNNTLGLHAAVWLEAKVHESRLDLWLRLYVMHRATEEAHVAPYR